MALAELDFAIALGGLAAGVLVGLTGMGGAIIVTPMLVLMFGVPPAAAISSDLAAGAVTKPVGALVHSRAGTVHWRLVAWISVGSIPGVLIGVVLFAQVLSHPGADATLRTLIGVVVLVALIAIPAKGWLARRAVRRSGIAPALAGSELPVRVTRTVMVGAAVGLLVGLTSVGSGSLVVTALMLMYPLLRPAVMVGTDLAQAVPMLAVGAVAHAGFGEILLPVVVSLLLGQIPGVWIGAKMSSRYDHHALRWLLMVVLGATAAKLLGAPSAVAAVIGATGVVGVGIATVGDRWRAQAANREVPNLVGQDR